MAKGGLTIDLSVTMNGVKVDPTRKEIVVQGGAIYTDIMAATQPYNLALPWGNGGRDSRCDCRMKQHLTVTVRLQQL